MFKDAPSAPSPSAPAARRPAGRSSTRPSLCSASAASRPPPCATSPPAPASSLGAAYYYFKSKEAIVGAYYDYVQQEHRGRARAAFERSRHPARPAARRPPHQDRHHAGRPAAAARAVPLRRRSGSPAVVVRSGHHANSARLSIDVFAEAIAGEKLPDDVREVAPTLLWTLHMGVLLYFLYDDSPSHRRTRKLIDAAGGFRRRRQARRDVAVDAAGAAAGVEHPARRGAARATCRHVAARGVRFVVESR